MIVAGRAVCTDCLESQALEDCQRPFCHPRTCEAIGEDAKHAWVVLHAILDCARG